MSQIKPETIILVIGILSALTGLQNLPDLKRKRTVFKVLFFAGIVIALATNVFQYGFAVTNKAQGRKEVENSTAVALYAFEKNDIGTLKAVAPDSFLVGYRLFKNGEMDQARVYFEQCIRNDQFTAPSQYLLAFMQTHANGVLRSDVDYTSALALLQRVTDSDPSYSPAFYLRAKLLANSRQTNAALDALEKAVFTPHYGYIPCRDINDLEEVKASLPALAGQERFLNMQRDCRLINHIASENK